MKYILPLLLILGAGLCEAATTTITIDYAVNQRVFVALGSGHTGHVDSSPHRPADEFLEDALAPYTWRNDNIDATDRRYDAVDVFTTSACNLYASRYSQECTSLDSSTPWTGTDKTAWMDDCTTLATTRNTNNQTGVYWDLWNEPEKAGAFTTPYCYDDHITVCTDHEDCPASYCAKHVNGLDLGQTMHWCYEALDTYYSAQDPPLTVIAGGPGMATGIFHTLGFLLAPGEEGEAVVDASDYIYKDQVRYGEWTQDFGMLEYLNTNSANVQFDYLSFHMFGDDHIMDWGEQIEILRDAIIAEMAEGEADELTNLISQWGSDLSNLPIYVTEMFGSHSSSEYDNGMDPGHVVVGLGELHEVNVAGASRACWNDIVEATSNCQDKTLSGLLLPDLVGSPSDPDTTRAVWWVYKYYAELEGGQETPVTSGYARVHGVASDVSANDEYRVLVGFTPHDRNGTNSPAFDTDELDILRIIMDGLGPNCVGADVIVKHIATTDHGGVFGEADLKRNSTSKVNVYNGRVVVDIGDFDASDAVYITVDTTDCTLNTHVTGGGVSGGSLQ